MGPCSKCKKWVCCCPLHSRMNVKLSAHDAKWATIRETMRLTGATVYSALTQYNLKQKGF